MFISYMYVDNLWGLNQKFGVRGTSLYLYKMHVYNIYILTQFTILLAYLSALNLQSFSFFLESNKTFSLKKKTLSQQFWISSLVFSRFMVFYGGSSTLSVTISSDRLIISNNKTINRCKSFTRNTYVVVAFGLQDG